MRKMTLTLLGTNLINGQYEKLLKEEWNIDGKVINPDFFISRYPHLRKEEIYGCEAYIDGENLIVHAEDFRFFNLKAFINSTPTVSYCIMSCISDNCTFNDLFVRRLDVENTNLILAESRVSELNVGIGSYIDNISKKKKAIEPGLVYTDIRDSKVDEIRVFVSNQFINIQGSNIQRLMLENQHIKTDAIRVWQNTNIERCKILGNVNTLQIKNSSISDLEFSEKTLVDSLDFKFSFVNRTHNCFPHTFVQKSIDSWKLVMDSARNSDDSSLLALAGYEYMKLKTRNLSLGFSKITSLLMEVTSGYGYKPRRTIISSLLLWLIFGMIYWVLAQFGLGGIKTSDGTIQRGLGGFAYSLYFSVIIFTTTGFGDITPVGVMAKVFSGLEAVMGISIMSLFIFTLTKRYGNSD
ncbi:MAG: hypothetical protein CVV34_03915 [Methanomicrobiales archaeon HGW-Methanomicrobiales-5]|jgi:hypothetical protein|nr:MAG: hypothetical protein CVV34_03915 [Methanomicrobiales archaeon HGW-Methanomicrobiales-5]